MNHFDIYTHSRTRHLKWVDGWIVARITRSRWNIALGAIMVTQIDLADYRTTPKLMLNKPVMNLIWQINVIHWLFDISHGMQMIHIRLRWGSAPSLSGGNGSEHHHFDHQNHHSSKFLIYIIRGFQCCKAGKSILCCTTHYVWSACRLLTGF